MSTAEIVMQSKPVIQLHSKSFSFASWFFSRDCADDAALLYHWCRFCDDQIDGEHDPRIQMEKLERLRSLTSDALNGRPVQEPAFRALQDLISRHQIPEIYFNDLLLGMEMDVRGQHYETLDDLLTYCYRVAGTVGTMMAHIMGVDHPVALNKAVHLGQAMQLTNIARDILEDFNRGRIYLPQKWIREENIIAADLAKTQHRPELVRIAKRTLLIADDLYFSGMEGLSHLNWRCACAVSVASEIYRDIGRVLIKRGGSAWDSRASTTLFRKIILSFKGVARVVTK